MTEREFTKQVIEIAQRFGWKVVHFETAQVGQRGAFRTPYMGDGKGFPDILAIRGVEMIIAELKVGKNRPTGEQVEWLARFAPFAMCHVWRPEDYDQITATFSVQRPV